MAGHATRQMSGMSLLLSFLLSFFFPSLMPPADPFGFVDGMCSVCWTDFGARGIFSLSNRLFREQG